MNAIQLTDDQKHILRHMLGIDVRTPRPTEYRNYYCANPGDERLHELQRLGMVALYSEHDGYEWFATTEAGRVAARQSQRRMVAKKSELRYLRFLDAREAHQDLAFREFLTHPHFAEARRGA